MLAVGAGVFVAVAPGVWVAVAIGVLVAVGAAVLFPVGVLLGVGVGAIVMPPPPPHAASNVTRTEAQKIKPCFEGFPIEYISNSMKLSDPIYFKRQISPPPEQGGVKGRNSLQKASKLVKNKRI